jgi:alkanesulfonate monooxygenase SsuD/methylene tetrahydromethanopterin reductase-like flavin-dependent oxidoreductase (luciferase family)
MEQEIEMEIGIYSLADLGPNPHTGNKISAKQRLCEIIEAAKVADEAGLDVFGVGEHRR